MRSYISPIIVDFIDEMVETAHKDQETAVMKRVKMVVDVDKDELLKALRYDRRQYEKGYQDGYTEAIEKVRTKLKEVDVECDDEVYVKAKELQKGVGFVDMRGEE